MDSVCVSSEIDTSLAPKAAFGLHSRVLQYGRQSPVILLDRYGYRQKPDGSFDSSTILPVFHKAIEFQRRQIVFYENRQTWLVPTKSRSILVAT